MNDAELEALLNRMIGEQRARVLRRFGTKVWDDANVAQLIDETETTLTVSSKLYGHGRITSTARLSDKSISHEWE